MVEPSLPEHLMADAVAEGMAEAEESGTGAGGTTNAPARRPLTQTAGLTGGRVAAAALSLGWAMAIARLLPTADVGALSLGLTLAVALSVLADLGLPMIVAERAAGHPDETRSLVRRVSVIRLGASAGTAVLLLVMYRLGTSATLAVPLLMAVSIAATAVHSTMTAALRGLGSVVPDGINEVASRLFVLGIGWWLLSNGHGIAAAAAVLAAADVISALVLTYVVHRRTHPGPVFPPGILHHRTVLPLAAALLIGSLHIRIDVWLLSLMGTSSDVAHYAVPARLAEGLLLPAGAAAALVLPLTVHAGGARARGRIALRYVALVAVVVAAGALVLGLIAEPVLDWAFGPHYRGDADVLRLLCIAAIPGAVSVGLAPVLAIQWRGAFTRLVVLALAVNVAVNLALIPAHKEIGAAIGTIISTTVAAVGMVIAAFRLPAGDGA
jgi:O-antigen/teichoic acid export membrane protein